MFRVSSAVYARKTASSTRCFFVMPVSSFPRNWQITTQSSYFSTVTGHVKSYNRIHAYGFIIPDESEGITTNVFVHRTEIAGVTDKTPFGFPYLRQGDRVQFEVRENNDKFVAQNVRNEDGSLIPIYRDPTAMTAFLKSSLGVAVYDILDDDNMSEGDKVSNIIEEFEKARSQINKLQATIQAQEEAASEIENAKEDEAAHSKTDEPLDTSMTVTEATDKEESRPV
jgi:cold shock CspA family protein